MDILASLLSGKIVSKPSQTGVDIVETLKQINAKKPPPPVKKSQAPKLSSKFLPEIPIQRRNSRVEAERSKTPTPRLSSKFLLEIPIPRRNSRVGEEKSAPLPRLSSKFLPEIPIPRMNPLVETERSKTPTPRLSSKFLPEALIPRAKRVEEVNTRSTTPKINIKFLPEGLFNDDSRTASPPPKGTVHRLSPNFLPEIWIPRQVASEIKPRMISYGNEVLPEIEKINPNMIHSLHYEVPKTDDMAVLFVFFDYVGSTRILMNYLYTAEKMKIAKIPYFTMELVLTGKTPRINDAFHVSSSSYLFQKEHLVRLLETKVPKKYTKLLSLDLDIIFDDYTWYGQLSQILDSNDVVQCFRTAKWLDVTYQHIEKEADTCTLHVKGKSFWDVGNPRSYHPGFGWAFNREWYNNVGYYDLGIIGSGDTIFSFALFEKYYGKEIENTEIYMKSRAEWITKLKDVKVGYLPVDIYHMYHGSMKKRQYVSRYEYFKRVKNIEDVSAINSTGAYELTDESLNNKMRMFFRERDDDGTD